MPSVGKLYNVPYMHQTKTILSVCALAGLEIEIPEYKHMEDNKKPEFLAKFPLGKIPAFEGANGFNLAEGAAIARYRYHKDEKIFSYSCPNIMSTASCYPDTLSVSLSCSGAAHSELAGLAPNSGLLGTTPEDAALVEQWVHFGDTEVAVLQDTVYAMIHNYLPYSKPLHTAIVERLIHHLTSIDTYLSTRTFLIGERITLADIAVASILARAVSVSVDAAVRAKLINIVRFLETIAHQPKLEAIFGPVQYVEKALQWTPPKKEKAPAPPAAPKEKKEKEKPKKVADDDDDEDDNL
ncbi:glutathione S-transferase, partial [Rhizopogon salebrosus TDB-379]